jgi:hypothetical protein
MDVQLISKQAESITKQQHHFESNLLAQTIMRLLVTGLSAPGWQQTALWTPLSQLKDNLPGMTHNPPSVLVSESICSLIKA